MKWWMSVLSHAKSQGEKNMETGGKEITASEGRSARIVSSSVTNSLATFSLANLWVCFLAICLSCSFIWSNNTLLVDLGAAFLVRLLTCTQAAYITNDLTSTFCIGCNDASRPWGQVYRSNHQNVCWMWSHLLTDRFVFVKRAQIRSCFLVGCNCNSTFCSTSVETQASIVIQTRC